MEEGLSAAAAGERIMVLEWEVTALDAYVTLLKAQLLTAGITPYRIEKDPFE